MKDPRNFVEWVCDPARTNDELFTVEVIIERERFSPRWPFQERQPDFDDSLTSLKARAANPAYRPALHKDEIEHLAGAPGEVTSFSGGSGGCDRPIRDLRALTFFPALTDVSVGGDLSDLSPLAALPGLERLSIGEYTDLAGGHFLRLADCGEMRALQYLSLSLHHAWPDLRALAHWPALREFRLNGNILACEDIAELPAARLVELNRRSWTGTPLRDLNKLPLMPVVKHLALDATESLEGIERYPSVVNLEVAGNFRDLTPLAAMTNLTALKLTGEFFRDLSPLSPLPKLREVRLVRERAIDLTPLADCPQLRQVEMERCSMMRTEVAALNAGLLPEAADFEAEKPRTVGPLKFFSKSKGNEAARKFFQQRDDAVFKERGRFYDGDGVFAKAEARAFTARLEARLGQLLGRGWGLLHGCPHHVSLKRFPDTCRVREVIGVLREESARWRWPWRFLLIVQPHGDMSEDLEDMKAREEAEDPPEGDWLAQCSEDEWDRREREEDRQRRYEFLKREHLLQLREGEGVDPALLSLPQTEDDPVNASEPEEPTTPSITDEEGGGVALAPPPPPPPETKSLGEELEFFLDVYEDCVVANEGWIEAARDNLGQQPVEWTPELEASEKRSS
jgi:hypothetical protein